MQGRRKLPAPGDQIQQRKTRQRKSKRVQDFLSKIRREITDRPSPLEIREISVECDLQPATILVSVNFVLSQSATTNILQAWFDDSRKAKYANKWSDSIAVDMNPQPLQEVAQEAAQGHAQEAAQVHASTPTRHANANPTV